MSESELKLKSRKAAETAVVKVIQTWHVWLVISVYPLMKILLAQNIHFT